MKKKIRITVIALIAIFTLTLSYYLIDRFSYSKELQFYPISVKNDTTLTIGIIGDSWVSRKKLDSLLNDELNKNGENSKIISSGLSSAKSKLIYQNMFKDSTDKHSSKFVIESHPDYCIVIAGVNDAQGQLGAKFYSYHITMIINTLLHYKIKPIIVELPEFGIIKATNEMSFIKKTRSKISSEFNNNGEIDNIKTYREDLNNLLKAQKLYDKIIFIDFDKVCSNYEECKEIYRIDGMHLNKDGNQLLIQCVVNELIKEITPR